MMVSLSVTHREPDPSSPPLPDSAVLSSVLSARAAALALGVNEKTVRRAIARGDLAAVRGSRSFQITRAALDQFRAQAKPHAGHPSSPVVAHNAASARPLLRALPRQAPSRLASLPAPLTSFIGRETEVAALAELVQRDDIRLVTLTGPGGIGKTRLALQVAEIVAGCFADGLAFVELAPVRQPADVLTAIASTIGVPDLGRRPLRDSLVSVLATRDLLLVLDNFEHVLEAAPRVADLLLHCRRVRVLASSRAPLGIAGEHLWAVAPLAATEPSSPAVQLFVERALAVAPEMRLNAPTLETISQICRRLEGLPLALELAAARMRLLTPEELLDRLDDRLPLLSGGPCDLPPRLRTLESAIGWSYDLLSPAQRRLWLRLAVFVGGLTVAAAEAIAAPDVPDPLKALQALVDHSLMARREDEAGQTRFMMLETVRAFAAARLAATGEERAARDAHAAWCLAFAEHADAELSGPRQAHWFTCLKAEHANMRAALTWSREQGEAERGLRLARALARYWGARGHYTEASAWFDTLLALPASITPQTRARAAMERSSMARWQGDGERAALFAEEALALFRELGDPAGTASALRCLASNALDQQAAERAASLLAESDALLANRGTPWDRAFSLYLAGRLANVSHDDETAMTRFAAAAEAFAAIGDRDFVAAALARQAAASMHLGDHAAARAAYAGSLRIAAETNEWSWVAWSLAGAARLAQREGQPLLAARFLGAASALRDAIGEHHTWDSDLEAAVRAALPADQGDAAWQEGRALPLAAAIAEAFASFAASPEASQPAPSTRNPLTSRERDVLRLLIDGLSDKEIAAALGIARYTVSNHVTAIRGKLGAPSRTAVAALAVRDRLI